MRESLSFFSFSFFFFVPNSSNQSSKKKEEEEQEKKLSLTVNVLFEMRSIAVCGILRPKGW